MQAVYLIDGARTPFGAFGGGLKGVTDVDLGVTAAKEAITRSSLLPEEMEEVVFGNVIHTTKAAAYLARHIGLKSGIPEQTPALTVNRLCGSGLQAMVSAAQTILLGDAQTALAGGTENMSQAPHVLRGTRFGSPYGPPPLDDMLWSTLTDEYIGCGMGITAENLAKKFEISREEQDAFAWQSHQKAREAQKSGRFSEEIVPVSYTDKKKRKKTISQDEHIRQAAELEGLSQLTPAFLKEGTVTAGSSSGINDGAAAVVLASESFLSSRPDIQPLARVRAWAIAGVDPNVMGIGPVPASEAALKKARLTWGDIGLIELNEAFAAQSLAVMKQLELDPQKVNVNGGAIALGHPVGASGTRITYSLALEMKKRGVKYGLASLCIGGGQGIAVVLEHP
ncbi:acetyl-CoA C-acetyltransferase [Pseudobacillus badius]|uniref:acetyl-CoA C-acetyltransferase n=1 Tax=Bacillus badius TaxID=1455 RepID=UPI0007B048DC|nr:acetyl-CoA C-acetyltransferase [Bacillus badius]KZN99682.1 beta-ketoadipyl CoA thiolase [Bacillus badius]OCS85787.1 beta-ketoadipyl CoA thiolase [Bacillus badius]OVE51855.1 beta-ketoadipyl CoA thiolase [Bacillus badius]TDW03284.1 acetyl-CoA C-acetyltransferase [Bacillus badius]